MTKHEHTITEEYGKNIVSLAVAFSITVVLMVVEFLGGIISGSLALISDAGHMLTDAGALGLALFALRFSRKPATPEKTYGFYRTEILSALLNGSVLLVLAGFIFFEAYQRFIHPREVQGILMLGIASIGFLANVTGAFMLSKGSRENLNVRGAFLHIISDALSSVGVILGGLIIVYTKFYLVDPIIGLIIGLLIVRGGWGLVRESVDILLEATPKDINLQKVIDALKKEIKGIRDVHDIHIWTITSGLRALSAHVLVEDTLVSECGEISKKVKNILREKFSIHHATLEFECESCPEGIVCRISH